MDLSTYTLPELRRLQAKVESEIRRRSDVTRRNLIKRMQKMAADEGLSLDDLLEGSTPAGAEAKPAAKRGRRPGTKTAKAAKPAPVIKYRNPANPDHCRIGGLFAVMQSAEPQPRRGCAEYAHRRGAHPSSRRSLRPSISPTARRIPRTAD